jgi:hypothetical protein
MQRFEHGINSWRPIAQHNAPPADAPNAELTYLKRLREYTSPDALPREHS